MLRKLIEKAVIPESAGRYNKACAGIGEYDAPLVLEVGPAATGIAQRLKPGARVIYADILESFGTGQASRVRASAEKLPFLDGIFPFVVCLDAMEHMPAGIRNDAVANMYRVTAPGGKLMISSPVGEAATEADQWLTDTLEAAGVGSHRWVAEHQAFGVPDFADYEAWFAGLEPQPQSVIRQDDLSVKAWKHALEIVAIPASRLNKGLAVARYAVEQHVTPLPDEPIYRSFYTIEK